MDVACTQVSPRQREKPTKKEQGNGRRQSSKKKWKTACVLAQNTTILPSYATIGRGSRVAERKWLLEGRNSTCGRAGPPGSSRWPTAAAEINHRSKIGRVNPWTARCQANNTHLPRSIGSGTLGHSIVKA